VPIVYAVQAVIENFPETRPILLLWEVGIWGGLFTVVVLLTALLLNPYQDRWLGSRWYSLLLLGANPSVGLLLFFHPAGQTWISLVLPLSEMQNLLLLVVLLIPWWRGDMEV
jgi:hypothetical protein